MRLFGEINCFLSCALSVGIFLGSCNIKDRKQSFLVKSNHKIQTVNIKIKKNQFSAHIFINLELIFYCELIYSFSIFNTLFFKQTLPQTCSNVEIINFQLRYSLYQQCQIRNIVFNSYLHSSMPWHRSCSLFLWYQFQSVVFCIFFVTLFSM